MKKNNIEPWIERKRHVHHPRARNNQKSRRREERTLDILPPGGGSVIIFGPNSHCDPTPPSARGYQLEVGEGGGQSGGSTTTYVQMQQRDKPETGSTASGSFYPFGEGGEWGGRIGRRHKWVVPWRRQRGRPSLHPVETG